MFSPAFCLLTISKFSTDLYDWKASIYCQEVVICARLHFQLLISDIGSNLSVNSKVSEPAQFWFRSVASFSSIAMADETYG